MSGRNGLAVPPLPSISTHTLTPPPLPARRMRVYGICIPLPPKSIRRPSGPILHSLHIHSSRECPLAGTHLKGAYEISRNYSIPPSPAMARKRPETRYSIPDVPRGPARLCPIRQRSVG